MTIETTPVDIKSLRDGYDQWVARIAANHGGSNHRVNETTAFVPLDKPLSTATMALVTTAGAHLDDQEPFHVETIAGDSGYRLIPNDADLNRLAFTHTHYDTSSAETDANCVLPVDPLNMAVAEGRIGAAAPFHVGLMGFNPDPTAIAEVTGPQVAQQLVDVGVDAVVLVPG